MCIPKNAYKNLWSSKGWSFKSSTTAFHAKFYPEENVEVDEGGCWPEYIHLASGEAIGIPISKQVQLDLKLDFEVIVQALYYLFILDCAIIEKAAMPVEINNWQIEWRIMSSDIAEVEPSTGSYLSKIMQIALTNFEGTGYDPTNVEAHLSHLAIYKPVEASDDLDYDEGSEKKNLKCFVEKEPGKCDLLV